MKRKIIFFFVLSALAIIFCGSCKKTYFRITDEVDPKSAGKFTIKKATYRMGRSIALTSGRFQLTPGDSIVLYIEGQGKVTGIGEQGVATLDFAETARFYMTLPIRLSLQEYDIGQKAICEITGNLNYGPGENLFVCQSGSVVVDSIKKDDVYGRFEGRYLNTRNKSFSVEGPFKAVLER